MLVMVMIIVAVIVVIMIVIVRVPAHDHDHDHDRGLIVLARLQKIRLDVQNAVEVEGVAAEHFLASEYSQRWVRCSRGVRIDPADTAFDLLQFVLADEVGLVEQDHVGECDLVLRLGRILEPVAQPLGVGDRHNCVELGLPSDVLVDEESLRDRRGVGQAGSLDDDGVELALPPHQPVDDAHEVASHGAADAPVVHLEHFLVGADDELVVDADLAEFVDDDGVFLSVRLGQDAVERVVLPAPR